MRNELWRALAAACTVSCGLACASAHAADSPVAGDGQAARLTRIESETAVLKAQARKAEVQAQIAAKQAETAARHAEARRSAPQRQAPMLRGIDGVGDTLYATLELPDQGLLDVHAGDKLPDGSKVVSVRANGVTLQQGKQQLKLMPSIAQAGAPGGGSGVALDAPLPDLPAPRGVRR